MYDKYYYAAQKARTLITQDYDAAYAKVDTILMPASPRTAFKFGELNDPTQMYLSDLYTISLNICGNGGISVPLGLGDDSKLPVSAQLVGPAFRDRQLLTFARALERGFADAATGARAFRRARFCREGRRAVMKELSEVLQDWEAVIGLEIHTELTALDTKMFCNCKLSHDDEPNAKRVPGVSGPARRPAGAQQARHREHRQGRSRHQLRDPAPLDVLPQALLLSRHGQELPDHAGSGRLCHVRSPGS